MFNSNPGNASASSGVVHKSQLFTIFQDTITPVTSNTTPLTLDYYNGYFWIADNTNDTAVQYDENLNPTGKTIYYGTEAVTLDGMASDGTHLYVLYNQTVYKYNISTETYTGTSYSLTTATVLVGSFRDLVFAGDGFWTSIGGSPGAAEKFDLSFVATGTFQSLADSLTTTDGMTYNIVSDELYYSTNGTKKVYRCDSVGVNLDNQDFTSFLVGTLYDIAYGPEDGAIRLLTSTNDVYRSYYGTKQTVFTWNKPAKFIEGTCRLTGTAGGGSGNSHATFQCGGSAGKYCIETPVDVSAVGSVAVTIGVGGATLTQTGSDQVGNNGASTSFGALLTLSGGAGGQSSTINVAANQTGGARGGYDNGQGLSNVQSNPSKYGGCSGQQANDTTFAGAGGGGLVLDDSGTIAGHGTAAATGGIGYGAGGGAGSANTVDGGAGADGALLVEWQEYA